MQVSREPLRRTVERRAHSYPQGGTKSSTMRRSSKARRRKNRSKRKADRRVIPIILAAGSAERLGFPQALARFGDLSALNIAVNNCAGLGKPVVVLGHAVRRILPAVPRGVKVVVHRGWRAGQMSSLRVGLRMVPKRGSFLLYPVDYPLLTGRLIRQLVSAFQRRPAGHAIVVPVFRGRKGHPVLFSPAIRSELVHAHSAREVVEKDLGRVKAVQVSTPAIWQDFDTPAAYQRCQRAYLRQRNASRE